MKKTVFPAGWQWFPEVSGSHWMESVAKKLLLMIALVASGLSRSAAVFHVSLQTCANLPTGSKTATPEE